MLHLTLRNLVARKVRLLLSAFAIVLGVGFVAGSFVFTDTMSSSFDKIAYGTVMDVNVRPEIKGQDAMTAAMNMDGRTLDSSLVDTIRGVPGVAQVDGTVQGAGLFVITKEGRLLGGTGAPTIGLNETDAGAVNAAGDPMVDWTSGRPPARHGEIGLDVRSAQSAGYQVGDTVKFVTAASTEVNTATLSGLMEFRSGGLAGATLVVFDTATAQQLFLDGKDAFTGIGVVAEPGVQNADLAQRIRAELPDGVEALTGEQLAAETKSLFDSMLGFLNTFLLVFAGIALVVGSFLIVNTFSMLVAQRSGELALLRALGASRRQVRVSVLVEAFVVGLVGAGLGLLFGFGLAGLLKIVLGYVGIDLSGTDLVFRPRTAVVALLVGVLVTMVSAYLPARRASKVPPIAAMRDDQAMSEGSLRWRVGLGVLLVLLGAGLLGTAVWGDVPKAGWWAGAGIVAALLGIIATSVVTSLPVLAVLGRAFTAIHGFVGRLAAQNARRNPRRTAATASALMIGLALVTTMSILGSSINASIDEGVEKEFTSDFLVMNPMGMPFSPDLAGEIAEVPGVRTVGAVQSIAATIGTTTVFADALDPDTLAELFPIRYVRGEPPREPGTIAFNESTAASLGLAVGQEVELGFASGPVRARVTGVYADSNVVGRATVPFSTVTEAGIKRTDTFLAVNKDESAGALTVLRGIERVTASNPALVVQDKESFAEAQRAQVNTLLYLIYALLGLAIVIAILGIVNTLALSVIERTRELGLLRAVGLERGQLRRMVRLESIAIAVLGAVLGIVAGVVFGTALQRTFVDEGITALWVPVGQLAIFLVIAAVVGVLAAVIPARRAAKLNILDAIAVE